MKTNPVALLALCSLCLLTGANSRAETVYQSVRGEAAFTSDGKSALDKHLIEVKDIPDKGKVARLPGSVNQWGYVNYWLGQAAPPGASIVRVKVYVEDAPTAPYALYVKREGIDPLVLKIEIPATAPKDSFVTIDLPVNLPQSWNGLSLKKIGSAPDPSPWIDSISLILP